MSHSLPPPPLGPSSEQFTRVTWSVPDSNDTSISAVIAYVIPRVRACILSIPKQLVPAPVWWTYERHRQRFSEERREQMTMLGEAIAQFAILLTARDVKPTIQDEERNALLSIIISPSFTKGVLAHLNYESIEGLYLDLGWASTGISNYKYALNVACTFFRPSVVHALPSLSRCVNETALQPSKTIVGPSDVSDIGSNGWSRPLQRLTKAVFEADKVHVEDDENPFLWTLIVHPQSDYGRQFVSLGRAFFMSMLMNIILLKFDLPPPLLKSTATIILSEETCATFLALMRVNIEDLPAAFKTHSSLCQMFFVATGMIACSEEGRWALDSAWANHVGEITRLCLRFQDVDPALHLRKASSW